MVLHYFIRNLLDSFKKNKFSFLLLIFVQAMSVMIILFSYGIFNHYECATNQIEGVSMYYSLQQANMEEWVLVDASKAKAYYYDVIDILGHKLDWIFVHGRYGDIKIDSSHRYRDGKFLVSKVVSQQYLPPVGMEGRYFTDEEMNNGAKVYYLVTDSMEDEVNSQKMIFGEMFTLVGKVNHDVMGSDNVHFIPLPSLPDGKYISGLSIEFLKPLTQSEHEEVSALAVKYFGDVFTIPEFDGENNESTKRVYRNYMFIAVLLTVVCVFNYYAIYDHILEKRKKTLAITRICGCKQYQAFAIYMLELVAISIAILAVFEAVYVKLILPKLYGTFEYMLEQYTTDFYVKFNIIYIVTLLIAYSVLVIRMIYKRPVALVKEV